MRSNWIRFLAVGCVLSIAAAVAVTRAAPPDQRGLIWAGCEVYNTFGTPANVSPGAGNFDALYKSPAGFRDGIGAISDAAPGYGRYNGGRWQEFVLKPGVDGGKYANACGVEDLDLNDFQATGVYFSCPLHKTR
ncbi:MAG: hypothetical protein OEX18_01770 [Candidatus Krumholzibacteria bacterium]|nr:hypothetical protein [Candidatus Krumholzibacteria bacterium]MDH4335987.1 hypothetical protein [Candidatus Krumholzibacteria bacterium]MDH5268437.1 hypothetical protein [Candidatus Krumholzibacteria bacterium]